MKKIAVLISLFMIIPILRGQDKLVVTSVEFYENYYHLLSDSNVVVIDGRTPEMFASGHILNAIQIDADVENVDVLLKAAAIKPTVVVICTTNRRTGDIIKYLDTFYMGQIIAINDGMRGWKENGLPIIMP
jgi:rhodanese-related sulfurtransferase